VIDRMHASVLEAKYCGLLLLCATDYLLVLANWRPQVPASTYAEG
jgi:hypothetical protein